MEKEGVHLGTKTLMVFFYILGAYVTIVGIFVFADFFENFVYGRSISRFVYGLLLAVFGIACLYVGNKLRKDKN